MKMLRPLATAVLALGVAVGLLAGCGSGEPSSGKPTVVASFYPLQYVAQRIAGHRARVLNLTRPGAEPHDLEMSVQQTREVVDASVVLYESGFQPAVDEAVQQNRPAHVVDAADVVAIRADNPHFWQDPLRLVPVARAFTQQMSAVEPAHAPEFRAHLAALRSDLHALDTAYRRGLAHCRVRTVVVSHDAFGYLSKYGLRFAAVTGLSPDAEPSPSRIAALQQLIRRRHVTTVFTEPLASPQLVEALAHDLGLRAATLDPIEGLTAATSHQTYLTLMRANLAALEKANRCT